MGKEEEKKEGSLWLLSRASRERFLGVAGADSGRESPGELAKAICVDSGIGRATATEQSQDTENSVSPIGGAQLSSERQVHEPRSGGLLSGPERCFLSGGL